MTTDGVYVYALAAGRIDPAVLGTGIDGRPLRTVEAGGVSAVVHDHRGAPFGGAEDEVRPRVLAHDAVVERVWASGAPVLPMTFDVIVAGDGEDTADVRLARWLGSAAGDIDERLRAVRGAVELRVDITLDAHAVARDTPEVATLQEQLDHATPGVQRLLRRRLAQREREVAERLADALHPGVRARLARLSVDLVEHRRAAVDAGEVLVLSAALLARDEATPRIGAELAALGAERGDLQLRFLGPWPPYSFAALRPDGVGAARPAGA